MSRDALVVGISSYRWLPDLGAPANDAEAIAQILHSQGDFRVQRMPEIVKNNQTQVGITTPVTVAELEAGLVKLFKPKGSHVPHTALFYYSGHGLQKDAGIQEGYLATSDANPDAGLYGLSLFWLRRLLQESPIRQRIIILDCCHSGEILNYLEADPGAKSGTDRLFMAASRDYESAYESLEGSHSVFTQALLAGFDPTSAANGTVTNYYLTDWVSNALRGEVQQPLFENSGGEIILTRHYNATTVLRPDQSQDICPYRGLEYFDESHADYFFGREDLTDHVIDKLRTRNFVAIVGASGSGKSSLVRAGLIHRLRLGRQFSGSDRWHIKIITPNDQPFKNLANAFVDPDASAIERAEQLRRAEILLNDNHGLAQLVRASLMTPEPGPSQSRMLLVIDQFEEIFTLFQGVHADRDRHRFFNRLIDALDSLGNQLSLVIVLRADFFCKCSLFTRLAEKIEQNLVTVTPLTYEQIKASIVKPAQRVGLFCEPNLTYNILRDIVGSPGELPLLQYTLLELWHRRAVDPDGGPAHLTLDAYTALGGVRGTLQKRADEIFYSLDPEEQRVAQRIFIGLTQLGDGTEDTRRRILKSELISVQFPAELVERVIEKLVRSKLIVTNQVTLTNRYQERLNQGFANVSTALRFAQMRRGKTQIHDPVQSSNFIQTVQAKISANYGLGFAKIKHFSAGHLPAPPVSAGLGDLSQETIDVAHETLIRYWELLRNWLDENRDMLRRQRKIEQAAREWDSLNQSRSLEDILRGSHLMDAEDFLELYPHELSEIAQKYIRVSRMENQRSHKELRLLQLSVPCTLLIALVVTLNQYQSLLRSQADKDYQIKVSTSRQQAAIAQSILHDPKGDPAAALLISRLAIERGDRTKEAEESLRAALQRLRLQANLVGHQGPVRQVEFSGNQSQMVTAGDDGTVRIWSLKDLALQHTLSWTRIPAADGDVPPDRAGPSPVAPITRMALSPGGQQIAAIAKAINYIQVWSVNSGQVRLQLRGFKAAATRLDFSANGNFIAAASADHEVRIWQAQSGVLQAQLRYSAPIQALQFSPDGQSALIASGNALRLIQIKTGQTQAVLSHSGTITRATFSPNGQWIAAGGQDGHLRIWSVNPSPPLAQRFKTYVHGPRGIAQVIFSPDSTALATIDQANHTKLWQVASGQVIPLQDGAIADMGRGSGRVEIAFSPDSQRLVATALQPPSDEANDNSRKPDPALRQWRVATGQALETLPTGPAETVQYSPDGALIATAGPDGTVRLWAATTGSELLPPASLNQPSQWVTFRPALDPAPPAAGPQPAALQPVSPQTAAPQTAAEMVAISLDGTLHRWHLPGNGARLAETAQLAQAKPLIPQGVGLSRALTAKVRRLWKKMGLWVQPGKPAIAAVVVPESPPRARPMATTNALVTLPPMQILDKLPPGATLMGVAFSADTQRLAISDSLGGVGIWNVHRDWSMTLVSRIQPPRTDERPTMIRQLALSPDQTQLLGVGDDRRIQIWEVASGKRRHSLVGHEAAITRAEFSPDGSLIVSASQDRTVRVWDGASGQELHSFPHRAGVMSARFSPDGQQLVIASQDGTAQVLDWQSGSYRVILVGHHGAVLDAGFSPDGQMLVTASEDGMAKLWNAQTGAERSSLRPGERGGEVRALQQAFFSPDGRYVATVDSDGQLRTWVVAWEDLLHLAQSRSFRQLKPEECLQYLGLPANGCPVLPIVQ